MKLSPLKLTSYFCSDISFSANREFDPAKPIELKVGEFTCTHKVEPVEQNERTYQVTLSLKHQTAKRSNSPCSYSVDVIGFFEIAEAYPAEKRERAVKVNAPSVLYGVARELVRSITAHGPFNAVIIPTVSFAEDATHSNPDLPAPENRVAKAIEGKL